MTWLTKFAPLCVIILVLSETVVKSTSLTIENKAEFLIDTLHAVEDALDEVSASCEIPMPVTRFIAMCRQIEKLLIKLKFKQRILPKMKSIVEKIELTISDITKRMKIGQIRSKPNFRFDGSYKMTTVSTREAEAVAETGTVTTSFDELIPEHDLLDDEFADEVLRNSRNDNSDTSSEDESELFDSSENNQNYDSVYETDILGWRGIKNW